MAFGVFKEKEVRKAILNKAELQVKGGKRSPHTKGNIVLDGKIVGMFLRIPNNHDKEFKKGKAGQVAETLKLDQDEYNRFVSCTMRKSEYFDILRKRVNKIN